MLRQLSLVFTLTAFSVTVAAEDIHHSWCQGYIVKGLAEFPIEGLSRTSLWLNWNAVSQHNIATDNFNEQQYQAGRDKFDSVHASGNTQSLIDTYTAQCELVKNTAWQWW